MKGSTHSFSVAVEPRFQVGAGHVPNGILVRSWSFHGPILRAPSTTCRTLEGKPQSAIASRAADPQ